MNQYFQHKFENKLVVILGFGLEGRSTYRFFEKYLPSCKLQIMDQNTDGIIDFFKDTKDIPFIYDKKDYLKFENEVDYIFKSPGIPLKQLDGQELLDKLTSQSNEFIALFREKIIGITGTKGKSTTCTFLYELLKAEGKNVVLVGNIGKPAFDYIHNNDEDTYYIYELSSHQLEMTFTSPKYGIILNIFEDHLDHYHSYEDYINAKMTMAKFQQESDYLIYSKLTDIINKRLKNTKGLRIPITRESADIGIQLLDDKVIIKWNKDKVILPYDIKRELMGDHNLINMAVAILISQIIGCDERSIRERCIKNFKGLPHRLTYVTTVNGVRYYNDSIATIPEATLVAIKSVEKVGTIIIGGMARGIHYDEMVGELNKMQFMNIILLPGSGHTLYNQLKHTERLYKVDTMEEAVEKAKNITRKGQACLLSPAAASYGYYKNFEERGNLFENLVRMN